MNPKVESRSLGRVGSLFFLPLIRFYCLLLIAVHRTHAGIEITDIFVPHLRLVGDDAELECRFVRSNGVRLYSIKWWKNNDQFYQYIPRNVPPKLPFNVAGIKVDTSMSSEEKVMLRQVTVETSGAFTCEVMADESFETVRRSDNMTVIDPPDGSKEGGDYGPFIEIIGIGIVESGTIDFRLGNKLEALCISRRAYPEAKLTWFINGREATSEFLTPISARKDSRRSYTSKLWLTFTLTEELFDKMGELKLVCNASLGQLYYRQAEVRIQNPLRRGALNYGLFSAGTALKVPVTFSVIAMLLVALNCSLDSYVFNTLSQFVQLARHSKRKETQCILVAQNQ